MRRRTSEIFQELGRSCRFLNTIAAGAPGYQLQAPAVHSSAGERKSGQRRKEPVGPPSFWSRFPIGSNESAVNLGRFVTASNSSVGLKE